MPHNSLFPLLKHASGIPFPCIPENQVFKSVALRTQSSFLTCQACFRTQSAYKLYSLLLRQEMTHLPPESSGGVKFVAMSVIFTAFSILVVGLRILAARIRRRIFRLHDYLSFAALVWMSLCTVVTDGLY